MCPLRRSLFLTVVALLVAATLPANAQYAILDSPPGSIQLREARIAVANGPSQSTTWFSALLEGSASAVHVVVPVAPGTRLDISTKAWFEALADSTDTRVLPPSHPLGTSCEQATLPAPGTFDLVGSTDPTKTAALSGPAAVVTFSELVVWAQANNMNLSLASLSAMADLDLQGHLFAVLPMKASPGMFLLPTVRSSMPWPQPKVPLVLTGASASPATLRVWVFAEGRANPSLRKWTAVDPGSVSWFAVSTVPPSDYRDVLSTLLDGSSWVVDASSHHALFRPVAIGTGSESIPSLTAGYLDRAWEYGHVAGNASSCVDRIAAMQSSSSKVGMVCAPGTLVNVGGIPCEEERKPGEIAPNDLRCGGIADDLALSLAGMRPGSTVLTRWVGRVPAWGAWGEDAVSVQGGASVSPIVACGAWDLSGCGESGGDVGPGGDGTDGSTGGGSNSWPPGVGEGSGSGEGHPAPGTWEDSYDGEDGSSDALVVVEAVVGCWGDTSTTSWSEEDSNSDGCSGDSSSSSSDSESCSGDSSSSSTSPGSDSCSGDSEGSTETCSGSSDGGNSCSVVRREGSRGRTLPVSVFGLLCAGCWLYVRRTERVGARG